MASTHQDTGVLNELVAHLVCTSVLSTACSSWGGGLIKLIIHPLLFSSFHLCNHLKEKKKNSPACQFCSPSLKSVLQPWHGSDISLRSRLRLEMKNKNKKDLITVVSDHHKNVSQTKEKVRPNAILVIYLYNRRRTVQIPQLTFCLT